MNPEKSSLINSDNEITRTVEDPISDESIESLEDILFSDDYDEVPEDPEAWLSEAAAQVLEDKEGSETNAENEEILPAEPFATCNNPPAENEEKNPFLDRLGIDYAPQHSQIESERRAFNKSFLEQKKVQGPENLPLGKLMDAVTEGTFRREPFQEKKVSPLRLGREDGATPAQSLAQNPELAVIDPEGSLRLKDAVSVMKVPNTFLRAGMTLQFSDVNSGPAKMPMEFRSGNSPQIHMGTFDAAAQTDTVMPIKEERTSRVCADGMPANQPKRDNTEERENRTKLFAGDERAETLERRGSSDQTEDSMRRLKHEKSRPVAKWKDSIRPFKKVKGIQRKTAKASRLGSVEPKAVLKREDRSALAFKEASKKRPEHKETDLLTISVAEEKVVVLTRPEKNRPKPERLKSGREKKNVSAGKRGERFSFSERKMKKDDSLKKERAVKPSAERVRKKTAKSEDLFWVERKTKSEDLMQPAERKHASCDSQMSMDGEVRKKKENMFNEWNRF